MVSWSDLSAAIQKNAQAGFCIAPITPRSDKHDIPMITKSVPTVPTTVVIPIAEPVPSPATPVITTWKLPRVTKTILDPIVIGIELQELLYMSAPRLTKHQFEVDEARRIEGLLSETYTHENGRSRGWTKTGLEHMIKPRCASGGDTKELERARVSFPWKCIRDDKLASAFLDFICVCKQIRVAVWDIESKIVALYPAADPLKKAKPAYPLYHISTNGELMIGSENLIQICDSNKFVLMPPLSVLKSLSGLTLDELGNIAKQVGIDDITGTKAERVAKIAAYKVRSRLS